MQNSDERAKQVASQKAKDNYSLARASAIKRKREGATEPDQPIPEPQRKLCHWNYLLVECAWMSQDIRSERRWRKHTAFILAHEAAAACGKLRKVNTGNKATSTASGAVSSCETGFDVSIKSEPGVANSGVSSMKCFKSSDIVSSSLLVYDYSLMKSALQITTEKLQERAIKRKIEVLGHLEQLEESEREYVACMRTSATVNHAAPNAAVVPERGMQAANAPEAWQDRSRRRQWVAGMRPDGEAALARRLPVEVAQQRRMDLSGEDDRLLMCLLAEFGEASPTLVAEVFSSIRRLDGVHMDRNIVVSRKQARQPVRKEDARSFLRWSMPCSGNSVLKYAQIIRPVAARMSQETKNDYENACMKRSEMAMHMASKHESHQAFIGEALNHFGGNVPSPGRLLAHRRSKPSEANAADARGAGVQGGANTPAGTPTGVGSNTVGPANSVAQQPGMEGAEGANAMPKNGNSTAGSPHAAGPGNSAPGGPSHAPAGSGPAPGAGHAGLGNGSMPMQQQPPPQQPMQRDTAPPGAYAVPAHAVHQHVHPHQVQAHAAHAKAGRPGGMVMPPQSGPMLQGGPDDQPMAMGPGGMMMQPQLVQVPASAAGMHPQYQSFDGMHMQPAMHQMQPRRGPHAQHPHPMHPQAMHMPMIDQDGMMTAPPMGHLMHMGPPMGSGPPQIAAMHPGMPQGPPGQHHHQQR